MLTSVDITEAQYIDVINVKTVISLISVDNFGEFFTVLFLKKLSAILHTDNYLILAGAILLHEDHFWLSMFYW